MRNAWLVVMAGALYAAPCLAFAQEHEGEHEHEEEERARLQIGFDFVLGLGRPIKETEDGIELKSPVVESFLFAAGYEVAEHFALGARFGFSIGDGVELEDTALNEPKQTVFAFTNVELEGEYETELDEHTTLALSLGVALPTAQGLVSDDAVGGSAAERRLIVQEAAARARGFEDTALFAPGYFSLIPKVALAHRAGALVLEAFLKFESSVYVASGDGGYAGELIPGGFAGYELAKLVTLGLRVWGNVAFQQLEESVLMVEPQARAQLGPLRLALGALLPIASHFDEPTVIGLRLTAAARF